jgi:hypothetical protein
MHMKSLSRYSWLRTDLLSVQLDPGENHNGVNSLPSNLFMTLELVGACSCTISALGLDQDMPKQAHHFWDHPSCEDEQGGSTSLSRQRHGMDPMLLAGGFCLAVIMV